MAAIRTVEDLTTDEDLIGYYDYEEAKEQETNARFEEGIKHGIKQNAIETAKKLIKEGIEPSITAKCTNLTLEDVENLKEMDTE